MPSKPRQMDPDRYQMRDLKRRIVSLEKENIYKSASLARFAAVLKETRGALVAVNIKCDMISGELEDLGARMTNLEESLDYFIATPPTQAPPAKDSPPGDE